jgi:hypothetical protein
MKFKLIVLLVSFLQLGVAPAVVEVIRNEQKATITAHLGFADPLLTEVKVKVLLQFNLLPFRDLIAENFTSNAEEIASRYSLLATRKSFK